MLAKKWDGGTVRLAWSRDTAGYVLRKRSKKKGDPTRFPDEEDEGIPDEFKSERIFALGGEIETYDIALGEKKVFADLLAMPATDEGALAFTSRWGMLHPFPFGTGRLIGLRSLMATAYEHKMSIHNLGPFFAQFTDLLGPIARAEIKFGKKSKRSPTELIWYVSSLRDFCYLEFFQDLGGTPHVAKCGSCGRFFTRSKVKGPAPEHCSNACRQRLYRVRLARKV